MPADAGLFSAGFNPERLELARRRNGWTIRELAEAADMSERAVAGYEGGDFPPPMATAERLAKALRFPIMFFSRSSPEPIPEQGATWRAMSRTTAAQRGRALAGGQLALELSDWIERQFDLPNPDIPDLRPQPDPESAALALRVHWGLGDKPIVNMVRLLEAKGVRVFSLAEECLEVDAFSFWRGKLPFVFLNTMKSAEHSRFDAAHELGHIVLHAHGTPVGRQAEREANAFASAFLMPRSSLLAFAPRSPTLVHLIGAKQIWKVSLAALTRRLHETKLLSAWHYRALWLELQKLGHHKAEPEGAAREMSQALERVFAALRAEGVSKNDLARELGWPVRELNSLVFQLVISASDGGGRIGQDAPNPAQEPKTQFEVMG